MSALHDPALLVSDHILALARAKLRILFHHEKRSLRDACVDGEKRPVLQEVHGIVAPFPGPDLASIDCQYLHQFAAVKSHDRLNGTDRKSTRLNSSHVKSSYAVVC